MRCSVLLIVFLACPVVVLALPFNDDMVDSQIKTGQVMRPRVEGTIPVGALAYRVKSKDDAKKLINPLKGNSDSEFRGKRLYAVNCYLCHGTPKLDGTAWKPTPVGTKVPGPNLGLSLYHDTAGSGSGQGRTDGDLYAQIHFGGVIMPRVGWKLSPTETWDTINYIRSVQQGR